MRLLAVFPAVTATLLILGAAPASAQATRGPGQAWSQAAGSPGSFPLHEEHGGATLIERTGLGSPSARMVGEFTRADIKEMCERIGWKFYSPSFPFHGTAQDRQTISLCRRAEEQRPEKDRRYVVRANCLEKVLYSHLGYTFRQVGGEWQTLTGRPVSGEFSPGYADVVSKQFGMLCLGTRS